jgi:site-specific recombinase XerD
MVVLQGKGNKERRVPMGGGCQKFCVNRGSDCLLEN